VLKFYVNFSNLRLDSITILTIIPSHNTKSANYGLAKDDNETMITMKMLIIMMTKRMIIQSDAS